MREKAGLLGLAVVSDLEVVWAYDRSDGFLVLCYLLVFFKVLCKVNVKSGGKDW